MRISGDKWDGNHFEINIEKINILQNAIRNKMQIEKEISSRELSEDIQMMEYVDGISCCNEWVFPDYNKTRFFIKKKDGEYTLGVIPYPPTYSNSDKEQILNSCDKDDIQFFTNIFESAQEAEADDNLVSGELHITLNSKEKSILDKEFEF